MWFQNTFSNLKKFFSTKCVVLIVSSLECLTFTFQKDAHEEFNTRSLFAFIFYLLQKERELLCDHK